MMRFNAPLLDVGWNPKQHCVAMVAAGGSFPLLVGYTDTPVVQETLKKDESTVGETILMASSHRYGNAEHTMNHTRRDSMMSGIVSAVMSSENEPRSKQILRTLAKARLSELRNRKFETVNSDDGEAKLDTPLRKQNSSVPAELLGRVDDDGDTSDTQIPLPSSSQYSAVDPSFH
jgi:hypothetical protein